MMGRGGVGLFSRIGTGRGNSVLVPLHGRKRRGGFALLFRIPFRVGGIGLMAAFLAQFVNLRPKFEQLFLGLI
ncbi:hypothetical protein [Verrucomicrobium sp. 3C]|uniref:hypothetical protein n=1 Tax=Verrucomicrobium sp. 3C TaxID=1134055 RepID=UPI00039C7C7B|nr:hypothetical protein [Verrucomicrobium sp. 3C]